MKVNTAHVRAPRRKLRQPGRSADPRRVEPRRTPQQQRSRKRVEGILEASRRLIGAHGSDAVSVRDIAAAERVPIASVSTR